jgi:membrane peptidoglycan carboxypeptidase
LVQAWPDPGQRGQVVVHRTVGLLLALLATAVAFGVLVAGLALPVTAVTGTAMADSGAYFLNLPSQLRTSILPQTSVLEAADGVPLAYFYDENRTVIPLAQMSPLIGSAVVAVEDARFFQHGPLDTRGLARAAVNDLSGGSTQGASTLTQQYVKNVLVEAAAASGDRAAVRAAIAPTVGRKIQELRYAVAVEQQLTKQQVLERYLNIVYFGERTYGVQAAAERYFGVPASRLTLPQAALLAGVVHDPVVDDPLLHPQAAHTRRDVVLADMRAQGMITPVQYTAAVATPVQATGRPLADGCSAAAASNDAFFCAYVVQSLIEDPRYAALGATPAAREHTLKTGGLVIRSTLDRRSQSVAVDAVNAAIPARDSSGLATTSVTVEPGTGAVTSMAEDRVYSVTPGRGRTSVNYATDAALGGASGFQTGSSFKPFTLAAWLAAGHTLDDTVDATQRAFPFSAFTACGRQLVGTQPYTPGNSEGTESGPMPVLSATANSVNVAYVDMESQLDLCDVAHTAESLGVHVSVAARPCPGTQPKATTGLPTCLPSLTLGVEDIAPLTMAAAYAGFASGGTFCAPVPVTTILKPATGGGTPPATLAAYGPSCRPAIDPQVASGVTQALTHVLTDGTAAAVGPLDPWPSAGKTGTTDGPYDTWFVGYTAQRSTAVWVGDPGRVVAGKNVRRRLTDISVGGKSYPIVFGASIAAPIWKDVMNGAMQALPAQQLP